MTLRRICSKKKNHFKFNGAINFIRPRGFLMREVWSLRLMRFILLVVSLLSCHAYGANVIGVEDGDTLIILDNRKPVKIRLAEIDAPEQGQAFFEASKRSLADLCIGKDASYKIQGTRKNGRLPAALVICGEVEANRAQIKRGMAWVEPRFSQDVSYVAIQDFVWRENIGLWADANPVPPWEWRKRETKNLNEASAPASDKSNSGND